MALSCPVCEAQNPDDAGECAVCGKVFVSELDLSEIEAPLEGLERTRLGSPAAEVPAERLGELEPTQLARRELPVPSEPMPDVERTALEEDPSAQSRWTGEVELDRGREPPDPARTPDPVELGRCPWCGAETSEAVCSNCGRRRSRYTAPRAAAAEDRAPAGDNVLCPACFSRVPPGPRCIECGVPFAVHEL